MVHGPEKSIDAGAGRADTSCVRINARAQGEAAVTDHPTPEVPTPVFNADVPNAAPDRPLTEAARRVSADRAWVVVVGQASMFIDALRAAHPDVVVIPAPELDLNSPTLGL